MDRRVWLSRRALKLHAVLLVVVPGFMALCVWQITRALGGNSLSWAYVFEWPLFAAYAVYMWWRLVHEGAEEETPPAAAHNGSGGRSAAAPTSPGAARDLTDAAEADPAAREQQEKEDAELAAYNEYLAQLAEQDEAAGR